MQRKFAFLTTCFGTLAFSFAAVAQNADANAAHKQLPVPLKAMAVPGTSTSNPFTSFDITYTDPQLQLMVLTSRSSKAVAVYDALFDRPLGETPAIFAGVGVDNAHSGPNGVVIAGDEIFAGDYPSQVQVFSLRTGRTPCS